MTTFVGIESNREKGTGTIRLSQASYVRKLLEAFDMSNAKPVSTPMVVGVQFPKRAAGIFPYRKAVGSLLFAIINNAISNAISNANRHQECSISVKPTPVRVRRRVYRGG